MIVVGWAGSGNLGTGKTQLLEARRQTTLGEIIQVTSAEQQREDRYHSGRWSNLAMTGEKAREQPMTMRW